MRRGGHRMHSAYTVHLQIPRGSSATHVSASLFGTVIPLQFWQARPVKDPYIVTALIKLRYTGTFIHITKNPSNHENFSVPPPQAMR